MTQLLIRLLPFLGARCLVLGPVDVEAARRVLEQAAVQQRVPRPRLGEWWRDVLTRVAEALAGIFDLSSATVRSLLTVASWGLIGLAAVVLLGWAFSLVLRGRKPSEDRGGTGVTTAVAVEQGRAVDWDRRLREALDRHDVSAALRAQWQLLFSRLGVDEAPTTGDASWTTRTVLRRLAARSPTSTTALRRLERWTYGGSRPAIEDLQRLRAEFDAVLSPIEARS